MKSSRANTTWNNCSSIFDIKGNTYVFPFCMLAKSQIFARSPRIKFLLVFQRKSTKLPAQPNKSVDFHTFLRQNRIFCSSAKENQQNCPLSQTNQSIPTLFFAKTEIFARLPKKNNKTARSAKQIGQFGGLEMHFAPICEAGRAKSSNCLAKLGKSVDLVVQKCILFQFARLEEQKLQIVSQN